MSGKGDFGSDKTGGFLIHGEEVPVSATGNLGFFAAQEGQLSNLSVDDDEPVVARSALHAQVVAAVTPVKPAPKDLGKHPADFDFDDHTPLGGYAL